MAKEDKNKKEEKDEAEEKSAEDGAEKDGEGAEGEEGGEGGKKKRAPLSKKKKLILLGASVLLVLAIAVPSILYFTGAFKPKSADAELAGEGGEGGEGVSKAVFYDMEEFLVNLNVGSKRPSFLKMSVSLEVANELQIPVVEKNMPRVRDNFQVYLRELRPEDLQGSAGLYRLREELLLRVNKVVYPAKVNDILFKEMLVQ
jgi:flagellar protein FliL